MPRNYLDEIKALCRENISRAKMKRHFYLGTGRKIPNGVNLRTFFSEWHATQQAINAGGTPTKFWCNAVGVEFPYAP